MTCEKFLSASHEKTLYAINTWEKAPFHVKSMAGAWMVPVLEALKAQQVAMEAIAEEVENGKA